MMKILEEGLSVCLTCGDGLDGAIIDYEAERNEAEPDCDFCKGKSDDVETVSWSSSNPTGEIEGECDSCTGSYELSSRDNRCGNCGDCGNCCTHKGKG